MKKLSLLFGMLLMLTSSAFAGGILNVKTINVRNLNAYEGKFVTAFYLSARASGFSYGNATPRINRVLKKTAPIKIVGGKATLPRTQVVQEGYYLFNYMKIVIHNAPVNIVLKNIDGSIPSGQSRTGETKYAKGFYVSKEKLGSLNSPAPVSITP